MTFREGALLLLAGLCAGGLNSIAGGGSFISFPMLLLFGVPPLNANATSTIALWPGSVASAIAYRPVLKTLGPELKWLSPLSLVGGIAGAVALLVTPEEALDRAVPFMLLAATLAFTFGPHVREHIRSATSHFWAGVVWFGISFYGGYFGGGMGLLMLAALSWGGIENVHRMNAMKAVQGALVNATAVLSFVVAGVVTWPEASVMILGASVGGYFGARWALKVPATRVRPWVIALGWGVTLVFFVKDFFGAGSPMK